jgi:hypothetical protein
MKKMTKLYLFYIAWRCKKVSLTRRKIKEAWNIANCLYYSVTYNLAIYFDYKQLPKLISIHHVV